MRDVHMVAERYESPLDEAMSVAREDLGLTWKQVADAAKISEQALTDVRKGRRSPRALTRRGIERALDWPRGYFDEVFARTTSGAAQKAADILDDLQGQKGIDQADDRKTG